VDKTSHIFLRVSSLLLSVALDACYISGLSSFASFLSALCLVDADALP
jgi:hypothetical protein